jgi:hypothetical protein
MKLYHKKAPVVPAAPKRRPGTTSPLTREAPLDVIPIATIDTTSHTDTTAPVEQAPDDTTTEPADDWVPHPQHIEITDNQTGINYSHLFGAYLADASHVRITDPYIRNIYQARYLMEFLETVAKYGPQESAITVTLVTDVTIVMLNVSSIFCIKSRTMHPR